MLYRLFPARAWDSKGKVDHYDCRKQPWYIGAITGPKEVIVLFDNSDKMSAFGKDHAEKVLNSILDTFTSHDRLNVILYSEGIKPLVDCFSDVLVSGAPEYIEAFRQASKNVEYDGDGDLKEAYSHSFKLLKQYRELRSSGDIGSESSQAIILITSELAKDFKNYAVDEFNEIGNENKVKALVRLFTYLLNDDDLSDTDARKTAACENRGYFGQIQREEDIQGQVFKYLEAIARPLVLDGTDHPVGWTTIVGFLWF